MDRGPKHAKSRAVLDNRFGSLCVLSFGRGPGSCHGRDEGQRRPDYGFPNSPRAMSQQGQPLSRTGHTIHIRPSGRGEVIIITSTEDSTRQLLRVDVPFTSFTGPYWPLANLHLEAGMLG